MTEFLITSAVLEATGIRSSMTLTRWAKEGLLPSPRVQNMPSGRGKTSMWPVETVELCLRILELRNQGRSFDEIKSALSADVNGDIDEEAISAAMEPKARFIDAVTNLLSELTLNRQRPAIMDRINYPVLHRTAAFLDLRGGYTKTRDLVSRGYRPFLLVNETFIAVVPDFLVSQLLSANAGSGYIVVPLLESLVNTISEEDDLPREISVWPVPKVWIEDESGEIVEQAFAIIGGYKFHLIAEVHGEIADPRENRDDILDADLAMLEDAPNEAEGGNSQ